MSGLGARRCRDRPARAVRGGGPDAAAGRDAAWLRVHERRERGRPLRGHGLRRRGSNRYLLETTGCGVALFDYDNDGRLDIFIVNGTTLEGFPKGQAPISHLYRNRGDGTFEDVTAKAGVGVSGWGQGAAAADYDNDGDRTSS